MLNLQIDLADVLTDDAEGQQLDAAKETDNAGHAGPPRDNEAADGLDDRPGDSCQTQHAKKHAKHQNHPDRPDGQTGDPV